MYQSGLSLKILGLRGLWPFGQKIFSHNCPTIDFPRVVDILIPPPECFELIRRSIAQGRVQPFLIIHLVDEIGNPLENIIEGAILPEVNLLSLERFHEAFSRCIIVRVALAGHADLKLVLFKLVDVILSSILYPLVRMMDHSRRRISVPDGHPERCKAQRCVNVP